MLTYLKKLFLKGLNSIGYDLRKTGTGPDLDLYYSIFSKEDIKKRCFYNIGAGLFSHIAWTNIDYYSNWYKENKIGISYDLFDLKPLPIDDNSANIIYSSHTVEHINDEAAQNMFNEAHRILKINGIIRLTMPDIDLCYKTIINNDRYFWKQMSDISSIPKYMASGNISKPMNSVSLKQIFLFIFASQIYLMMKMNIK